MVFIMVVGIRKSAYGMEMKVETPMSNGYELITPLWVSTHEVSPNILAKGTTIYSEAYVRAKRTSGVISGRMYIEKFTSRTWIRVASWQLSGTGNTFLVFAEANHKLGWLYGEWSPESIGTYK